MSEIDIFDGAKLMDYDKAVRSGLIKLLGSETDEVFLEKVLSQSLDTEPLRRVADRYKVVYTPFHGVAIRWCPMFLADWAART